jgi:P27 family predicted phage terminase small subunit
VTRRPAGPPRLPANVHQLRGNPSKLSADELEEREAVEIKARPLTLSAPADLSPHAAECWRRLVPELQSLGLLTVLDAESLRMACETWAIAVYALEELRPRKKDGSVDQRAKRLEVLQVDGVHGGQLKRHSGVMVFLQAQAAWVKWCTEFGLSPAARAALRPGAGRPAGTGATDADDDDDAFFGT